MKESFFFSFFLENTFHIKARKAFPRNYCCHLCIFFDVKEIWRGPHCRHPQGFIVRRINEIRDRSLVIISDLYDKTDD